MLSKSILIAILSTLVATNAAPVRRDITVKSGDTCSALAAAAGTTVAALLAANPSINAGCTNLAVGQVISTAGGGGGGAAPPAAGGSGGDVSVAAVLAVAPNSAACNGAQASCRTAQQAAPLITNGFNQFGISSKGEKAALLSLMAFETGGFVFDTNQAGNPGQGTRNLMQFNFVLKYVLETPSVAGQVGQIVPGLNENSPADVVNNVPADKKNAIRALVLEDNLSFASAAWFLKTKCAPNFSSALASGTQAAYESYLTGCLFTTVTPERLAGFNAAIAAVN